MARRESGFVAAVVGALLVACGAAAYHPAWLLAAAGAVAVLAGLLAVGQRGSLPLALAGGWLILPVFLPWAAAPWNAMLGGLALLAFGFASGAEGTASRAG